MAHPLQRQHSLLLLLYICYYQFFISFRAALLLILSISVSFPTTLNISNSMLSYLASQSSYLFRSCCSSHFLALPVSQGVAFRFPFGFKEFLRIAFMKCMGIWEDTKEALRAVGRLLQDNLAAELHASLWAQMCNVYSWSVFNHNGIVETQHFVADFMQF